MSRPFHTERLSIVRELLSQHFKLLALRYDIPTHDAAWHQLETCVRTTYHANTDQPNQNVLRDHQASLKILVASHWQVYCTEEKEPPSYLIAAVDVIEQSCHAWFSYTQKAWIED